ncbi:hypothetical protein ARMGADRAFT_362347 [Armillaria gallica]|uniref:Uncharacterized protein n=1 Tax=Armillaria gallica TaxID=47427 RepID=A0A2H3CZZ9_ARMGA|nr:hypothetical protein ARMGADRAFT_362347 [Armillaria gallica]
MRVQIVPTCLPSCSSLAVLILSVDPHTKESYPLKDRAVLKNLRARRSNRHLAESKHLCMSYPIHRRRARHVHVWKRRLSFVTEAGCVIWLRGASKRPSESSSTASQYASAWETRAQTCISCKDKRKSWTI